MAHESSSSVVFRSELDRAVGDLVGGLPTWITLPTGRRVELLRALRRRLGRQAAAIVATLSRQQGYDPDGFWGAEPWGLLFGMAQDVRALEWVLGRLADGREPLPAGVVHQRDDGRVVVDTYPVRWDEKALFVGTSSQTWMPVGVAPEEVRARAAAAYRGSGFAEPGVAVLLAAGNVPTLTLTDLLHLLFAEGCVVAVKLNPVLRELRPAFEALFCDFVDAGWVRFVDDSPAAGGYLVAHSLVDRVHMTGSAGTYDALVWGDDGDQDHRKRAGTPLLHKPFTAELGGVSPTVVVPGRWDDGDVRRQAGRVVYAKLFNCGHICCSPQILVLPQGWEAGERLLDEIRRLMRTLPARSPYYPGSAEKVDRLIRDRTCEVMLDPRHRILVPEVDVDRDDPLLTTEVFADVLGVVRLPASSTDSYLSAATVFCNERCAGTLAADLVVDPVTERECTAVGTAIEALRYGTVGVNEWSVAAVNRGYTTWGAFPGHTPQEIGSGIGTVINAFMLDEPEKTVVRSRFRPLLPTLTSVNTRNAAVTIRRAFSYLVTDDPRHIPGMVASAVRG